MKIKLDVSYVPYKDYGNLRDLYNQLLEKNARLTDENIDLHNEILELLLRLKSKYNPKLKPGIESYLQNRGL